MELKDKVVIISGATRGIGKAIVELLIKEKATVAVFSSQKKNVDSFANEMQALNSDSNVFCDVVDIRNADQVSKFIHKVKEIYGSVDILINNAAVIRPGPLDEMPEEDWNLVMDTNLKGPFNTMKAVIPLMKDQKGGMILNICSILGKKAFPDFSLHCASKFGLRGLSLSAKEELRKYDIQVMIVNPGSVSTRMWDHIDGDHDYGQMVQPKEVASSVIHVLKNADNCVINELDITPKNDLAI